MPLSFNLFAGFLLIIIGTISKIYCFKINDRKKKF